MTGWVEPDPVAVELSRQVSDPKARNSIAAVLLRVESALAATPAQRQAWEPIALRFLPFETPPAVQSCWIFVLRAGAKFGPERHPNSHQRTVVLSGAARFEILEDTTWTRRPLRGGAGAPDVSSCISIPPGAWHRIDVGPQSCVCVSFHTVPAEELIEETPVEDDLAITTQRRYQSSG